MVRKRDFRSHSERYGYEYTNVRQIVPYRLPRSEFEPTAVPIQPVSVNPDFPVTRESRIHGKGRQSKELYFRHRPMSLKCKYEVRIYDIEKDRLIGSVRPARGAFVLLEPDIPRHGTYRLNVQCPDKSWTVTIHEHAPHEMRNDGQRSEPRPAQTASQRRFSRSK